MTHPHKTKGDAFERAVLAAVQDLRFHAYRTFNAGQPSDVGDLHIRAERNDLVLQCKNVKQWKPSSFVVDARTQAVRASATILDDAVGVAVIKRIGTANPLHSYCLLELSDLLRLVE